MKTKRQLLWELKQIDRCREALDKLAVRVNGELGRTCKPRLVSKDEGHSEHGGCSAHHGPAHRAMMCSCFEGTELVKPVLRFCTKAQQPVPGHT